MDPTDIRSLVEHLKTTQMEMEFCVRDGKCHIGRIHFVSAAYFVVVIDLEELMFELLMYSDIISIKILTV